MQIVVKTPHTKCHERPSRGSRFVSCGETGWS